MPTRALVTLALLVSTLLGGCASQSEKAATPSSTTTTAPSTTATTPATTATKPAPKLDVIWVPSPPEVIKAMLDAAKVGPNDVVYDLGCGEGEILIAASASATPTPTRPGPGSPIASPSSNRTCSRPT